MMTEHMKRFLSMLVEGLLAPAIRLARLAAVRHEVEAYTEAFDEAAALESSGVPAKQKLAKLLLAELEGSIISTALPAAPLPERALEVDGNHRPFALEPPRAAEPGPSADQPASEPQRQDTPPPPRRRGRPPGSKKNQTKAAEDTKPGAAEASPEQPQPGVTLLWDANV